MKFYWFSAAFFSALVSGILVQKFLEQHQPNHLGMAVFCALVSLGFSALSIASVIEKKEK